MRGQNGRRGACAHKSEEVRGGFRKAGQRVRIEDDVLVTPSGRRNLSARIPSTVEDLEAIVGQG